MNQKEKLLTIELLNYLSKKYSMSTEQNKYLERIKASYNISPKSDFKIEEIQKINDVSSITRIYTVAREFMFLRDNSCFSPEIFDYFSVSFIEQKRVIKEIYDKYKDGGLDKILEKYPVDVNKDKLTDTTSKGQYYVNSSQEENLRLGKAYLYGIGVPKNIDKAKEYLESAADWGSSEAGELLRKIGEHSDTFGLVSAVKMISGGLNTTKKISESLNTTLNINYSEARDNLILAQKAYESNQVQDVIRYLKIAENYGSKGASNILKLLPRAKKISVDLAFKSAIDEMTTKI